MKKNYAILLCIAVAMFSFVGTANAGTGTKEDPYTCEELLGLSSGSGLWVVGYITGSFNGVYGMLLSDDVEGTSAIAVKLAAGDQRTSLNPDTDPNCLNKKVKVKGNRGKYSRKEGLESITEYEWVVDAAAPAITITPISIDFGNVDLNETAKAKTITLTAANLTKNVTVSFEKTENNPFSSSVAEIVAADAVTDNINISLNTATVGNYTNKLIFTHDGTVLAQVVLKANIAEPLPAGAVVETFDNYPETSGSYKDSSFVGINDITWTYTSCRGDININGNAPTLKAKSASIVSSSISGGCGTIRLNYMQAFSNTADFKILINGVEKGTFTTTKQNEILNTGDIEVNVEGDFTIKIEQNSGGNQVTIDDIVWTPYTGTTTAINTCPTIENVTFSGNIIRNANQQMLSVYNVAGKLLVSSNSDIDMSTYVAGIYIVRSADAVLKIVK